MKRFDRKKNDLIGPKIIFYIIERIKKIHNYALFVILKFVIFVIYMVYLG